MTGVTVGWVGVSGGLAHADAGVMANEQQPDCARGRMAADSGNRSADAALNPTPIYRDNPVAPTTQ